MALATQGFGVTALPIAPQFPGSVGEFDSLRARKNAADQLKLVKQLSNLDAEQRATKAKLALQTQQSTADQALVDPGVEDKLAGLDVSTRTNRVRSNVLREAGPDMQRGGVLSAKADVGKQEAALSDQERLKTMREQSKSEVETVRRKFAEASNLADHDMEANDLEQIIADHPWIAALPEYKDQARLLDEHIKSARQRALEQQKGIAAQGRADTIATGGVQKAQVAATAAGAGKPAEAEREANNFTKFTQMAAEATDPDDAEMYRQRAALAKQRLDVLNTPKTAPGAVANEKAARGARHAVDAAAANAERMGSMIDRIIPRVSRTGGAGIGSILSVIPETEARALHADIDSLKANIGFNELNTLRQQSPTGGALGQVSERELAFLQNVLASLDTKLAPDVLKANLARAKEDIMKSAARLRAAYEQDFPAAATGGGAAHEVGKTYTDASGNKAIYRGPGQWEEVK